MQPGISFFLIFLLQVTCNPSRQCALGKTRTQVIAMRGADYKKLIDRGSPVLQYKTNITNDAKFGNYTISELIYFERDTCIKDVTILPANQAANYIDFYNKQFKPAGFHSWMGADSSFITIALRDGLLDITSFSAAYYKNLSGH